MISNNTIIAILLVALVLNHVASASTNNNSKTDSPPTQHILTRMYLYVFKPKRKSDSILKDTTDKVQDVQPREKGVVEVEQVIPSISEQFKKLMDEGKDGEIEKLIYSMSNDEFLKQVCLTVKTDGHYKVVAKYLRDRRLSLTFFVHGDEEAINDVVRTGYGAGGIKYYFDSGAMENSLFEAFKGSHYDRFIILFAARHHAIKKSYPQLRDEEQRRVEYILDTFFRNLAFDVNNMSLKKFLVFHGEKFSKYPDAHEMFLQKLIERSEYHSSCGNTHELLPILVERYPQLTPKMLAKGLFTRCVDDDTYNNFIRYGWAEAIEEALKWEYRGGGERLWEFMIRKFPDRFSGGYSRSPEFRAAVSSKFTAREQLYEKLNREKAQRFLWQLEKIITNIFPSVLTTIIFEYAEPVPTLLDY